MIPGDVRLPAVLVWFRRDLRLADTPALLAAAERGRPLLPVFVLDDETPVGWTRQRNEKFSCRACGMI